MAAIETTKNMRLLAQHELNGFGNVGEGMVIQLARDGRRVLWLAHESAPKNVTAVDVSDPRKPSVIYQSDLPHTEMRSNSLDLVGDLLVVAYQTKSVGMQPAGVEIFDVGDPTRPKRVGFFDASGPHSRGCHQLWFVDGKTVHMACADPEGNRVELFVDTPWHTPQPFAEPFDLEAPAETIMAQTEAICRSRPGFSSRADWGRRQAARMGAEA